MIDDAYRIFRFIMLTIWLALDCVNFDLLFAIFVPFVADIANKEIKNLLAILF